MSDREENILKKIKEIVYKTDPIGRDNFIWFSCRGTCQGNTSDWDLLIFTEPDKILH